MELTKKPKCNHCGKKVKAKTKVHKVGSDLLHYYRCSNCHTIYPGYVMNDSIDKQMLEVSKMRTEAWTQTEEGPSSTVTRKLDLSREILHRARSIEYMSKNVLVKKNMENFEKLGERIIWEEWVPHEI